MRMAFNYVLLNPIYSGLRQFIHVQCCYIGKTGVMEVYAIRCMERTEVAIVWCMSRVSVKDGMLSRTFGSSMCCSCC